MKRLKWKLTALIAWVLGVFPSLVLAAGEKADMIVIVADSRKLTGIMAWWANMYNHSHIQFALLTIVIIPIIGVIFGVLADLIMTHIGIDLKSRDLAEH